MHGLRSGISLSDKGTLPKFKGLMIIRACAHSGEKVQQKVTPRRVTVLNDDDDVDKTVAPEMQRLLRQPRSVIPDNACYLPASGKTAL